MEEILERQLLIRSRAFTTFYIIKKVLAGRMRPADRMFCRPVQGDLYVNHWCYYDSEKIKNVFM